VGCDRHTTLVEASSLRAVDEALALILDL